MTARCQPRFAPLARSRSRKRKRANVESGPSAAAAGICPPANFPTRADRAQDAILLQMLRKHRLYLTILN